MTKIKCIKKLNVRLVNKKTKIDKNVKTPAAVTIMRVLNSRRS